MALMIEEKFEKRIQKDVSFQDLCKKQQVLNKQLRRQTDCDEAEDVQYKEIEKLGELGRTDLLYRKVTSQKKKQDLIPNEQKWRKADTVKRRLEQIEPVKKAP